MRVKNLMAVILFFPAVINAQEKLSKLQSPTSPASSILGIQPSVVLSPKSYQALETALFSNFNNQAGGSIIPNDFALEFSPYWTQNHHLSLQEYLYPKSPVDQFIRNSSFSIASTQNYLLGDSSASNGLSFGYRTTFYFGNKADRDKVVEFTTALRATMETNIKISSEVEKMFDMNLITSQKQLMDTIKPLMMKAVRASGKFGNLEEAELFVNEIITASSLIPALDVKNYYPYLDSLYSLIDNRLASEPIFNKYKAYIVERYGFSIDLAYAGLVNFPSNRFESSYMARQSIWVTPTYRFKDKWRFLKVMGVLRYEWYNIDYYEIYFSNSQVFANAFDYGLSVAAEFGKFSLRCEAVGKYSKSDFPAGTDSQGNSLYRKDKKSDFQYIGAFNYNLGNQLVLSYSLGNRFEPVVNPENTLVSMLSLNIGFGSPTKQDIDWDK
ncbi:MAG: hypothetical protein WC341_06910 [Bacteroidales bacterium]|jgi:hypothetical protein